MQSYNQLTVNLEAIAANLTAIQKHLPASCRVMPMVKALGYGTCGKSLALFAQKQGFDIVGVSHVIEGVQLRNHGAEGAIFAIHAAPFEAKSAVEAGLEVAISDATLCHALNDEALRVSKRVKVHLHLNTGMHRFGCRPKEALGLARLIEELPALTLEGFMTHFVAAESPSFDSVTHEQIALFRSTLATLHAHGMTPRFIHAANSAGALRFSLPECNMVRLGLAPFGVSSSPAERASLSLTAALTLQSQLVAINECHQGEHIGYFQEYTVKRPEERIAILPLGYHDGLHLHYSGKGYVLIHGCKAPYVGRICMDFMMVDITDIPQAKVGDRALLFGQEGSSHIPLESFAAWGNTNVRELLTSLGPRITRYFSN